MKTKDTKDQQDDVKSKVFSARSSSMSETNLFINSLRINNVGDFLINTHPLTFEGKAVDSHLLSMDFSKKVKLCKLLKLLVEIDDFHVILQTIRPVKLEDNNCEPDKTR